MFHLIVAVLIVWLLVAAMCQGPVSQDDRHAANLQQLANKHWHELEKRQEKTR